ncbi:MAG: glycerophosphodiester phosphodiesterase family protein [Thiogranum sp.]|jgi:glycerophosphoryl diester phosphodiesterase
MTETAIPQLVAHRGYMRLYPENSRPGLQAALEAGACWLEFDVQMCRNGEFVVLHDDNFVRTAGVDRSVFDLDSDRITVSVHEPQRFAERFAPTSVATLTAVLQMLADWPAARAMVEIKQESIDRWGMEPVMRKLVPLLASHQPQCTLIAYNSQTLEWCRQRAAIPVGWVLQAYDGAHRKRAEALAPDFLICNQTKLPDNATPWPGPWQWMLYDIVEPDQAVAWAARGVSLIETADIGGMLQDSRLKQRACPHGAL